MLKDFSDSEKQEFLKNIIKGKTDEVFFFRYFLGMTVHEGQKEWSRKSTKVVNILSCGNKWGKTAFTAARHIHKNFYKLGANGDPEDVERMEYQTLVISPVSSQSARTKQYIEQILNSSFSWNDPKTGHRVTNKCKIGWFFINAVSGEKACINYLNGSRTDIRSIGDDKGSKIQGSDYYFISYDEYSRSHHLEEEMEANILPRLALYGGNLDLIGTPDKDSPSLQYCFELIQSSKEDDSPYYVQGGAMRDNTFISAENRDRTLAAIKDEQTRKQVEDGEIVFAGGRVFDAQVIANIWLPDAEWKEESYDLFRDYISEDEYKTELMGYVFEVPPTEEGPNGKYIGGKYLISMDWHLSDGGDETVIYVIRYDVEPYRLVYFLATRRGNPFVKHDKVRNLHRIYNNASLVVDSQGVGRQLQYDLEDLEPTCFDWTSQGKDKKVMIQILKNYLAFKVGITLVGKFRAPRIKTLSDQLAAYKEDDKALKQDHVMTLGVAAWWIENEGGIILTPPDKRR